MPPGEVEQFTVRAAGGATLVLRSDEVVDAEMAAGGTTVPLRAHPVPGRFDYARAKLPADASAIVLRAVGAPLRDFHVWIMAP